MARDDFESLVEAVRHVESRGRRYAADAKTLLTSHKGAQGEMQVMPKTQRSPGFGVEPAKPGDPEEIARVGRDYLKAMLDKYGDRDHALAAYNWGPGKVDKWLAQGADPAKLPEETRNYLVKVNKQLGAKTANVPRETPQPQTEAEKVMEPALRAGQTAQAPVQTPAASQQLAELGPNYQAALALSVLADVDEEERKDRDVDDDSQPSVAQKWLAEQGSRPSALASLSDISIKSPFPAPARMADGGDVKKRLSGLMPSYVRPTAKSLLEELKEAVEKAAEKGRTPAGMGMVLGYEGFKKMTGNRYTPLEDAQRIADRATEKVNEDWDPTGDMEPVSRADGGDVSRPAFIYPKSGRGRKISTQPGELEAAALQGVSETPYNVVGAPVDLMTMAMRPFGYNVQTPVGGSDWIKQKMLEQGIRQAPPTNPAARAIYGAAELGSSAVNPAAPVRAAARTAEKTGEAARMLAQDFQQYNRQLSVPGASYAVKPRGGTFAMGHAEKEGEIKPISNLQETLDKYRNEAINKNAPDAVLRFIEEKAPKYFTTVYGTADDPLRTAMRERTLLPLGQAEKEIYFPGYMMQAAKDPAAEAHELAKKNLESTYDRLANIQSFILKNESTPPMYEVRSDISRKMAQEGVPEEYMNIPYPEIHSAQEAANYPNNARQLLAMLKMREQGRLPSNLTFALEKGEPIYDVKPGLAVLKPDEVVDALSQIPPNKLKNMSFADAIVQGNVELKPIRDYDLAIEKAAKGAKVPEQSLQMFTKPAIDVDQGQWVQLINPKATKMEGYLMNHSVGGYADGDSYGTPYTHLPYGGKKAFDDGLVQVYSLRDKSNFLPLVTVEVAKSEKGNGLFWDVTQIRGKFNSEPTAEQKSEVLKLLGHLDDTMGLAEIKSNTYSMNAKGEKVTPTSVNWAQEYLNQPKLPPSTQE